MEYDKEIQNLLKEKLWEYYPERFLVENIRSVHDIYTHRLTLKRMYCNTSVLHHILPIIIDANANGVRHRTHDCLRVIRGILRNGDTRCIVDPEAIQQLFYLFQLFVFHRNPEVQACVNSCLIDQILDDQNITWIINHYNLSHHCTNRLLRYPRYHPLIAEWALECYIKGDLESRRSELIACMIEDEIPQVALEADTDTLLWAIFYSRLSISNKAMMLCRYFVPDSVETLLQICDRLKDPTAIELVLAQNQTKQSNGNTNSSNE